jgi:hypothetical protein
MIIAIEKNCLTCNKAIRGRSDKKFCNDACRNSYNNLHRPGATDAIRRINSLLIKNRKILEQLCRNGERRKVTREQLIVLGFAFSFYTNTYQNKKGSVYFFCYDYGWLDLNDSILVVKSAIPC